MKVINLGLLAMAALAWSACSRTAQVDPHEGDSNPGGGSFSPGTGDGNAPSGVGGTNDGVLATGGTFGGAIAVGGSIAGTVATGGVTSPGTAIRPVGGSTIGAGGIIAPGGGNGDGPPPTNCVPATETSTASDCQLDLSCDNDWVSTYCYNQGSDNWYCYCNSNYRSLAFQVSGSDSSTACGSISALCSAAEPLSFTEPALCTTDYQSFGVNNCDLGMTCTSTLDVGNGVTAQQSTYRSANCYNNGTALTCQCSNGQVYRSYEISGVDVGSSCQLTVDLCDSGDEPVFSDPAVCQVTYQDASSGYCYQEQRCRSTSLVSDGITAVLDDYQYANCQDLGTGVAVCDCSSVQGYMRFETAGSASDQNTCTGALQVCTNAETIALSGPISCERNYQSASGQYCDAQLTCKQAGALNDQQLLVYGDLYVSCNQQVAGGAWTCTCSSGQASASFEVATADGWDVCSMAADSCPSEIDVQIGMNGNGGIMATKVPVPVLVP